MQLAGFIMGLLSACGSLITCVMPEWRKNDMAGEIIEMQVRKQGIWWNCMFYSTGQWHCDDFDRFFIGLPAELQTARALMIIACLTGFVGYVAGNVGLSCTTFLEDNLVAKKRLAMLSAVCYGVGALCTGIAVSFYAAVVVQDFYMSGGMAGAGLNNSMNTSQAGNRYVYGTALFIGWISSFTGILGMVVQICGSRGDDDDEPYNNNTNPYTTNQPYTNQAFPKPRNIGGGTEYI